MKTCSTCKWWDRNGECSKVDSVYSPDDRRKVVREPRTFLMVVDVSDDTGLDYKLLTGPDFGCVLHESKP